MKLLPNGIPKIAEVLLCVNRIIDYFRITMINSTLKSTTSAMFLPLVVIAKQNVINDKLIL